MKKLFVRYCGGCNPEYDRVAAVMRLAEDGGFGMTAEKGEAELRIAVSGCPRRCAGKQSEDLREISSLKQMEETIAEMEL